jgi:hypothetical protein
MKQLLIAENKNRINYLIINMVSGLSDRKLNKSSRKKNYSHISGSA